MNNPGTAEMTKWESLISEPTIETRNINPSAYRVLYILLLLVRQKQLNIDEINQALSQHPQIARSFNTETMLKYINTLRKSGCKIPRVSKKNDYRYRLMNNPVPLNLTPPEIELALKVEQLLENHPDQSLSLTYQQFLSEVIWALPKEQALEISGVRHAVKPLQPKRKRKSGNKTVEKFQQYCRDEQIIEVTLVKALYPDETLVRQIEPYDVVTDHQEIANQEMRYFLMAYDTVLQKNIKLDMAKIVSVRQLPRKIKREQITTQVMFQVYGRLAKSYRPYPDEEMMFSQGDTLQIVANTSDTDALLSRLMKYGTACQVLAPASMRLAMKQRIKLLIDAMAASV